jgi:hypothetical protein
MTRNYRACIVLLLLACLIITVTPVSALQSTEQSLSESMTRGSRFTITITGVPNTAYYVWLPGTFSMTGEPYDQPPVIADSLENVVKDPSGGPYTIGSYQYSNGGGNTILDDVAPSTSSMSSTNYYAQATTDSKGQAIVEFQTSVYTKTRSYSVKVENPNAPEKENFQVEQKVYSRASRPMIETPQETIVTSPPRTSLTIPPTTVPTLLPETPRATTPIPSTPPTPAKKAPLEPWTVVIAAGIGMLALMRR